MSAIEEIEEPRLRVTKTPHLRVLTGGKGPPDEPVNNWLGTLSAGHTIAVRATVKTVDFEVYYVMYDTPELYLLKWCLPDGRAWDRHVDPEQFSKHHPHYVIMGYTKPKEIEEQKAPEEVEVEDGNSDRTD